MDPVSVGLANRAKDFSLRRSTPAPYYRSYTPTFRETFGDTARWVPASNATVANDPDNYSVAGLDLRESGTWTPTAGHSLKVTKTSTTAASAQATATLSQALDITGRHMLVRYFTHDGEGAASPSTLTSLTILVLDSLDRAAYISTTRDLVQPGFHTRPFRSADWVNTTSCDLTDIVKIQVWFQTAGNNTATPSMSFDFLEFIPKLNTPIPYILGFDGGYELHKPALAYMAARGMKAMLYPTIDRVGVGSRMTVDELRQAELMGHVVDAHEREDGDTGWNTLSQSAKERSLREAMDWKFRNGFVQSAGFAPLGTQFLYDSDLVGTLTPFLDHVRVGGHNGTLVLWNPRVIGASYDTAAMTSAADEVAVREAAKTYGTMCSGVIHALTGAFDLDEFKTMIDNIAADTDVRVVTAYELANHDWYAQV